MNLLIELAAPVVPLDVEVFVFQVREMRLGVLIQFIPELFTKRICKRERVVACFALEMEARSHVLMRKVDDRSEVSGGHGSGNQNTVRNSNLPLKKLISAVQFSSKVFTDIPWPPWQDIVVHG